MMGFAALNPSYRRPLSIIAIGAPRAVAAARTVPVIGAADARAADAADRLHALPVAAVVATHGAAGSPAAVDGAPRVVIGGLRVARAGGRKQGRDDEGRVDRSHGSISG